MHSNSSHFHVPSCGCDPEEERQFQQMMRNKVQRDPADAVRTLSTFQPPMGLLQAVANLVLTDHRIRRAGATSIFIRYITEGYVNPAEPMPDLSITASMDWETPLIGIINTLVAISKESAPLQSQDNEIRDSYNSRVRPAKLCIWRDLSHLLPPGPSTDFRRRLVSQTMVNFVNIPNMKSNMYDETSISLAMHCWLYMSPDRDSRKHAASIIGVLFGGLEENLPQVGPGVKVIAVRSVTIDAINLRVSSILGDETVLDENLEGELYALDCFSKSRHPFSSAFIRFRIYDHVVNALQRQLKNGSPQFTVDVLQTGHILLGNISASAKNGDETMTCFTDMVGNTCLLEVASSGLILAHKLGLDMWYNLLDRIAHTIECKSPKCLFKVTPAFRKGTRSSFERVYIPTLHTLRESGTPDSKALNLWERIARDLEVSEASVRCKWRVEKQCCNPECPKRKLSNVKVMACVRCQSVFYCGRTCQKSDWKHYHKANCRKDVAA